jgi:DNA replicative helicase MCM subunit Mcm2 (Cdc46/Mcm family)
LGTNFVTPRGLNSKMGNQLVGIQGIATRVSVSRYQLEKSVHWCEKTTSAIYK